MSDKDTRVSPEILDLRKILKGRGREFKDRQPLKIFGIRPKKHRTPLITTFMSRT